MFFCSSRGNFNKIRFQVLVEKLLYVFIQYLKILLHMTISGIIFSNKNLFIIVLVKSMVIKIFWFPIKLIPLFLTSRMKKQGKLRMLFEIHVLDSGASIICHKGCFVSQYFPFCFLQNVCWPPPWHYFVCMVFEVFDINWEIKFIDLYL